MIPAVIGALVVGVVVAAELLSRLVADRQMRSVWCRCGHRLDAHLYFARVGRYPGSACGCCSGSDVSRETSPDWGSA